MESRHLGPIELDGGAGGGSMEAVIDFAGERVPTRLEIDYPDRLTQSLIDDIDVMLDYPDVADGIARETIEDAMRRDDSAPSQLFQVWERARWGRESSAKQFLESLRPTKMVITPDGGRANLDRVVLSYGVSDSPVVGNITVRLLQSAPPEVDRAPAGGFG